MLAYTLFAALFFSSASAQNWTAYRILPNSTSVPNAVCLDGSPPLYYVSPGFGDGVDKWEIHMEGGAWCRGDDCSDWWGYRSTWADPDVMAPDAMASTGYFNRSDGTNAMARWNFVFIRYCEFLTQALGAPEPLIFNPLTPLPGRRTYPKNPPTLGDGW